MTPPRPRRRWSRYAAMFALAAMTHSTVAGATPAREGRPASLRRATAKPAETGGDWKGFDSAVERFETVVARTPGEWKVLWDRHAAHVRPRPAPPEVDFGRWMVVGVFAGEAPTAGFAVEIVDVRPSLDRVLVHYRESIPPPHVAVAALLTFPFHLRAVPRADGPIEFRKMR